MREIVFRGKRTVGGEWVEGAFAPHAHPVNAYIIRHGSTLWVQVDPETVGQYTGLNDRNGRKIFEGDVCEVHWAPPGRKPVRLRYSVVYSKSGFFFKDTTVMGQVSNYTNVGPYLFVEVIGNIHDNPELLTCREENLQ